MKKLSKGGLPCYQFHLIEGFSEDINHAVFTRGGGTSAAPYNSLNVSFHQKDERAKVLENRRRVMKAMGLSYCISALQTHSKNVVVIDAENRAEIFSNGRRTVEVEDTDAFVTNQRGIGLMIKVADCQTILFYDPGKKILGLAHAGWRGLKQNISAEVIAAMVKLGAIPSHILVGIAPSLGQANSEFTDPAKELGPDFIPFVKNRKVDLWEFSRHQLMQLGIQERRIENARIDTANAEEGRQFFSYRREGETGRFAVVAMIK
jgi:polyphenol oxidase